MKRSELFISAQALRSIVNNATINRAEQNAQNLVVIDCRFSLADTEAGQTAYAHSHITGAIYWHLDNDLSSTITKKTGRHPLPSLSTFDQLCANSGIRKDSSVVVYDDGKLAFAARAWFLLHLFGYHRVRILEGGFNAWQASESQEVTHHGVTDHDIHPSLPFSAVAVPIKQVTLDEAEQLSNGRWVDAREAYRFLGESEPIDAIAGSIPQATNVVWLDAFDSEGQFKPSEWHTKRWEAIKNNPDPEKIPVKPIHYCGSGVTALVNILSCLLASDEPQWFYPGGWSEYIALKSLIDGS